MASVDSLSILITASTASAVTKVEALTKSLEGLASAIDALDVSKFESLANAVTDLSNGFAGIKGGAAKDIGKIAKAVSNVAEQKDAFDPIKKGAEETAEETKKVAENADKLSAATNKIDTSSIDGMASSMEVVAQTLDNTTMKMSAFKSLLAKTKIIIPTEGLEKVDTRIDRLKEKIGDLQDKLIFKSQTQVGYVNSEEMEKDKEKIAGLINELERLRLKKQELESHGGFKLNLSGVFSSLQSTLTNVNKKLSSFTSHMFKAKSAARDTAKQTRSFDTAAKTLAKSLTKVTRMLKLMITRMALRTVIKETGNGFKSLALHCQEFDSAMSGIINSSKTLAYSFAGMVGPLINALAPALIYIINLITKLINAFNQLFSAISGSGIWHKAKDFTGNWSDDIQAANKQAKELKKTVLGFDELNQLQDNKSSGGGGGSNNIEDMFDDVAIEAKFQDLAKKIKSILTKLLDPIKKAWKAVGKEVVAAWSGAFKSVKTLLSDIGRDFLKVWDQPRTVQMIKTILLIFKDIGGIVKYLADNLDKAWNTNHLGLKILSNIRDIFLDIVTHIRNMSFATLEWAKNLEFTPLLEAFKNWVVSMKPVVDAIAGAFEDFYTKVLLPLGKWSIEKGLPELIQVFTDFNDKVDWDGLRSKLSDLWTHLEPFAETVGEGLIQFIRDCSNAIADFVNSKTFSDFLDKIKEWMDDVDAEDVARTIKLVAGAIITLKGALFLLEGIKGITATVEALKTFFALFGAGGAAAEGAKVMGEAATAVETFGNALTGLGAVASIIETFKFASKQSDINELNEDLKQGKVSIDEYNDAVKQIQWGKVVEEGYSWKQALKDFLNPFNDTDIVGSIRNMKNETDGLTQSADNLSIQIEKDTGSVNDLSNSVNKVNFQPISEGVKRLDGDTNRSFHTIKTNGEVMARTVDKEATNAFSNVKLVVGQSMESVEMDTANAEYALEGSWQEMSKASEEGAKDIVDSTDSVKKAFDKNEWTFSGVGEGLKKTFQEAKEKIAPIWNSIADKLNGQHKIGFSTMDINLPRFATGGFPKDDSVFMANSSEMLGKFSNGRNVVANNQQITDGIAKAVYSAMMSANAGGGGNVPVYATFQVDGETIARAVTKGQKSLNRRYSPTMG